MAAGSLPASVRAFLPAEPAGAPKRERSHGKSCMKKRHNTPLAGLMAFTLAAAFLAGMPEPGRGKAVADEPAYAIEMTDVTAKVGEPAVLHAILHVRDGYRVLKSYNNRVIELSSFDDGVSFDTRVVKATVQEGGLDFAIPLKATKAGKHPINGYFRVGYIGEGEFAMVSLRLIANVNGTE
jgi:hypothetical protein